MPKFRYHPPAEQGRVAHLAAASSLFRTNRRPYLRFQFVPDWLLFCCHMSRRIFCEQTWRSLGDGALCAPSFEARSCTVGSALSCSCSRYECSNFLLAKMLWVSGSGDHCCTYRITYIFLLCGSLSKRVLVTQHLNISPCARQYRLAYSHA